MARPRTHPFWVERIKLLLANNPAMSGAEIRRRLANDQKGISAEPAPTPVPSDRAIRRIMADFPEAEHLPYRVFAWPDSMESGALPWEASRACLDLLRFRRERNMAEPLIRECQWFWRVSQAIPDAPVKERADIAHMLILHAMASGPSPGLLTRVQWRLAYQVTSRDWSRSEADREAYKLLPEDLRGPLRVAVDAANPEHRQQLLAGLPAFFSRLPWGEAAYESGAKIRCEIAGPLQEKAKSKPESKQTKKGARK